MLQAQGFESSCHLFGAHIDGVVLDHRGSQWTVFLIERGSEYDARVHATEDDACRDVLDRMYKYVRRPAEGG